MDALARLLEGNRRLEAELAACRREQARLGASEQRYRSVVAALREGIVLHDAEGRVTSFNAAALEILGLTAEEVVGRTPLELPCRVLHEDGRPFTGEGHPVAATLRTGQPTRSVVMRVVRPDGSSRRVVAGAEPLREHGDAAPWAVLASFADVTESRIAAEESRRAAERLRFTLELSERAPALSDAEIAGEALDTAVRLTASDWGVVLEPCSEAARGSWHVLACRGPGAPGGDAARERGLDCARSRSPLLRGWGAEPDQVWVPALDGAEVRVVLAVGGRRSAYDDATVGQLQIVAADVLRLVLRRRADDALRESEASLAVLVEQLEGSNEMLSAIAAAQSRFISAGSASEALGGLLRLLVSATGCDGGAIVEAADEAEGQAEARALADQGWIGQLPAETVSRLLAQVLETGRAAVEPGRAAVVPLKRDSHVVGLLAFTSSRPETLEGALVGRLQPVASTIATLLEAGRAFRLRERAEARHREALGRALRADADLRLRVAAIEAAANAIVLCDRAGTILWVNAAFTALTGWSAAEIIGKNPRVMSSGAHDRSFFAGLWSTILRGEVWRGDLLNRRKDGRLYHEEMTVAPIRGENGELTHFVAIKQSLEWRDAAERQMRRSERRFRRLVQGVEAIVWEADARSGRLTFVNERAEQVLGYPISEWLADPDFRLLHTHRDDRAALRPLLEPMPNGAQHQDFRMIAADGREIWFHEIVRLEGESADAHLAGVMIDVSRARLLENAVRAAADEWVATFDAMESAVFLLDARGRIRRLNRAAAALARGSWRDLVGGQLSALGVGEPWSSAAALAAEVGAGQAAQGRQVAGAEGRSWHVEATSTRAIAGREPQVIVTVRDVTHVVELQDSVKQAQTMATIGSVVAGVAHEVRNPLFAMSVNIDVLAAELGEAPEVRELIEALRVERDRISRLMQDLLDFGRPLSGARRECQLERILERAIAQVRPVALARGVAIRAEGAARASAARRPGAARAGVPERARERLPALAVGQRRIAGVLGRGRPRARARPRRRPGLRPGGAATGVRAVLHAPQGRNRPGAGDRAADRGAARRQRRGGERRGTGRGGHRAPARAARGGVAGCPLQPSRRPLLLLRGIRFRAPERRFRPRTANR